MILATALVLTGCSHPQADFDRAFALAQESLASRDFAMAEAHIADALEALPESAAGEELKHRIAVGKFSNQVLTEVQEAVDSGNWRMSVDSAAKLSQQHPDLEAVRELSAGAINDFLTSSLTDFDGADESEVSTIEADLSWILRTVTDDVTYDESLFDTLRATLLAARREEWTAKLETKDLDTAAKAVKAAASLELYDPKEFTAASKLVIAAFAASILGKSKSLSSEKKFSAALELIDAAVEDIGANEALSSERNRIEKLITARAEAERKAKEEAKKHAIRAMYVEEDTFEGIKWYYDRGTYSRYAGNKFELYIGQRGSGTPWMWLRFQIYEDSWHFFERITLNVDGQKYEFSPGYQEVKRDNGSGNVWEWYDHKPSSVDKEMLRQIIGSNSTRIRYINDDNEYIERTVSSAQKKALANVLLAYEALGGQ